MVFLSMLVCRENERQSAPDVLVVDSAETHEVSANVTVETTTTLSSLNLVKSRSQIAAEQNLINFGLAIPHDILLGELTLNRFFITKWLSLLEKIRYIRVAFFKDI